MNVHVHTLYTTTLCASNILQDMQLCINILTGSEGSSFFLLLWLPKLAMGRGGGRGSVNSLVYAGGSLMLP